MAAGTHTNRKVARVGNRAKLTVAGLTVGVAQNVSFDVSFSHQPLVGLGSPDPFENVPGIAQYRVSMSRAIIRVNNLEAEGYSSDEKDTTGDEIFSRNGDRALEGRVFDITVIEDGVLLRTIHKCSFDSGSVRVDAGRIIMENASFVGIGST